MFFGFTVFISRIVTNLSSKISTYEHSTDIEIGGHRAASKELWATR